MIARLYRFALCAFPRRHRDAYAAEMIDAFERELARRRAQGPRATLPFAVAAFTNLLVMGIAERRRRHVVRFGYFFSALDFTLAWRMLLRYPGLSIVGVFGMAVGIAIATAAFTKRGSASRAGSWITAATGTPFRPVAVDFLLKMRRSHCLHGEPVEP